MTKRFHGIKQTLAKYPKKRKSFLRTTAASPPIASPLTFSPWYVRELSSELRGEISDTIPQRDEAWAIAPYPCLGNFTFLELGLSRSSLYPEVLSRVEAGDTLLDLGCAFGQDIRKLVFDGAPAENLYGTDLHAGLMEAGYSLFLDRPSLCSVFVAADIFDSTLTSPLAQLHGRIDIVYAGSFLHLFDWESQVAVAKRLVTLLRPRKGALVTGRQLGHVSAGSYPLGIDASGTMFRHDVASFERLWQVVGDETGSTWRVDALLEPAKPAGFTKAGEWGDPDGRLLKFSVLRDD